MVDERETIKMLEQKLKYLFITRDKALLVEQITILNDIASNIKEAKEKFIAKQDEANSNKWLSIESISLSILNGLIMFTELQKNNPEPAWNSLISAQNHAYWSSIAYELPTTTIQRDCSNHFYNIEKVLFPSQIFMSVGMVVAESICSICQKQTSKCEHIRGEVYMGEICGQIHAKIKSVNEVSIVNVPADKQCRVTRYQENSMWINKMTLVGTPLNQPERDIISTT